VSKTGDFSDVFVIDANGRKKDALERSRQNFRCGDERAYADGGKPRLYEKIDI
jgi:hypothetical protein